MNLHCLWSLIDLQIQNRLFNLQPTRLQMLLNLDLSVTMHTFVVSSFDNVYSGVKRLIQVALGFGV